MGWLLMWVCLLKHKVIQRTTFVVLQLDSVEPRNFLNLNSNYNGDSTVVPISTQYGLHVKFLGFGPAIRQKLLSTFPVIKFLTRENYDRVHLVVSEPVSNLSLPAVVVKSICCR